VTTSTECRNNEDWQVCLCDAVTPTCCVEEYEQCAAAARNIAFVMWDMQFHAPLSPNMIYLLLINV